MGRRSADRDAFIINAAEEMMTSSFRRSSHHDIEGAIHHSLEVGKILGEHDCNAEEVAGGILHDVVEDTDMTLEEINLRTTSKVHMIVRDCTDDPAWKNLPTLERKRLQAQRMKNCPASSRKVKLADGISNMRRLTHSPPPTWTAKKKADWLEGTRLIYVACEKNLHRGVDRSLLDEFLRTYNEARESLLAAQT